MARGVDVVTTRDPLTGLAIFASVCGQVEMRPIDMKHSTLYGRVHSYHFWRVTIELPKIQSIAGSSILGVQSPIEHKSLSYNIIVLTCNLINVLSKLIDN